MTQANINTAVNATSANQFSHQDVINFVMGRELNGVNQVVTIQFKCNNIYFNQVVSLELRLRKAVIKAGVGKFHSSLMAKDDGDCYIFMYGPNADKLIEVIKPLLRYVLFVRDIELIKTVQPTENWDTEFELNDRSIDDILADIDKRKT